MAKWNIQGIYLFDEPLAQTLGPLDEVGECRCGTRWPFGQSSVAWSALTFNACCRSCHASLGPRPRPRPFRAHLARYTHTFVPPAEFPWHTSRRRSKQNVMIAMGWEEMDVWFMTGRRWAGLGGSVDRWTGGLVDWWTGGLVTRRFPGWVHLADSRDARGPLALPSIMGSGSPRLPFPYPSKIKAAAICTHKLFISVYIYSICIYRCIWVYI